MALQVRKYSNLELVDLILKGGIIGGSAITQIASEGLTQVSASVTAQSALYLHGKTLVFLAPAVTVTFVASPAGVNSPMTLRAAMAQILSQTTNAVKPQLIQGRMALVHATAASAISLDNVGTANSLFGFAGDADTVGTKYAAPAGAAPALVSIVPCNNDNSYLVVTNEP